MRKNSGISSFSDLKGKKIAFDYSGPTSAHFFPPPILTSSSLELLEPSSPRENPPADKLGFAIAGVERNIKVREHRALTEASKFIHQGWEKPEHGPNTMKRDLTIANSNQEVSSESI